MERLIEAGLLVADYARPEGRSGPGSGRPAKHYVPSDAEITLEVPPRRYALAGRLLVRAIEEGGSRVSARDAAMRIAAEEGNRLGREFADRSPGADVVAAVDLLCELGFEAVMDDSGGLTLANCPFHALADASPQLVCGMNEALLHGLIDGLGVDDVEAVLDPGDGRCCVVLSRARHSHGSARRDSARSMRNTVAN